MANKIIKYKWHSDNTVPFFVADGGYYRNQSNGTFLGVSVDGFEPTHLQEASGVDEFNATYQGELTSEAAIKSYLDTYTSGWKYYPEEGNTQEDFNSENAAWKLWEKKKS